jgi:acyl carrier protein
MTKEQVTEIIYRAIDEINLEFNLSLQKKDESKLVGEIDSIILVNLIVKIEFEMNRNARKVISIDSDKAFSQVNSPFLTVGTLTDYVYTLI